MRREKTLEVDDKTITVKELKTKDVIEMLEGKEGIELLIGVNTGLPSDMKKLMKKSVDMSEEEFEALTEGINAFSILEQAFREVNADFFGFLQARVNGLLNSAELMAGQIKRTFKSPASLSRKDI